MGLIPDPEKCPPEFATLITELQFLTDIRAEVYDKLDALLTEHGAPKSCLRLAY
jgi:hypothetical protein